MPDRTVVLQPSARVTEHAVRLVHVDHRVIPAVGAPVWVVETGPLPICGADSFRGGIGGDAEDVVERGDRVSVLG